MHDTVSPADTVRRQPRRIGVTMRAVGRVAVAACQEARASPVRRVHYETDDRPATGPSGRARGSAGSWVASRPRRSSSSPSCSIRRINASPIEEAICSMMARSLGVLGAANRWWRIVPPGVGSNSVVASSVSQTTTSLCFDIPNAAKAAEELAEQGLTTDWWDEAFNRQARVEGPYGAISLNEEMDDTYGYKVTEPIGPSVVDVVATVYTPEFERPTHFFNHLGYRPDGGDAPGWRPLRADTTSGIIGLHESTQPPQEHQDATTELGFETLEPLAQLAERLRSAGHSVEDLTMDPDPPHLVVTDPDGSPIEISAARKDPRTDLTDEAT